MKIALERDPRQHSRVASPSEYSMEESFTAPKVSIDIA